MSTLDTLCKRKSVRSYNGEQITEEELNKILKAGQASPCGMMQYDKMNITVISNKDLLKEIDEAGAKMFGKPDMHPLYGVPTLVLVSAEEPDKMMENMVYSNAAIIAHDIALEAVELGVGSCYIWGAVASLFQSPEVMVKLNLPEGYIPCCAIGLGHTDEKYEERDITEKIKVSRIN